MAKIKVFFAGSMHGGRDDAELYKEIVDYLEPRCKLLSNHVGYGDGTKLTDDEIYSKDMKKIEEADMLIAEVSTPSIGVGYEVAMAMNFGKKVVCLYRTGAKNPLSPMVGGNHKFTVLKYGTLDEAKIRLDALLSESE